MRVGAKERAEARSQLKEWPNDELGTALRDAERYRWLRDKWIVPGSVAFPWGDIEKTPASANAMDARIDAAIVCAHPAIYRRLFGAPPYCVFCGEPLPSDHSKDDPFSAVP